MDARFKIIRDDSIPAFAGWQAGSLKSGDPTILLNVDVSFSPLFYEDGEESEVDTPDRKLMIVENLMHEFGHALQEYFDLEFDEDIIESFVINYREKYIEKFGEREE